MARRPDSQSVTNRKYELVRAAIAGRESASSTALSASYGLPADEIRKVLREARISDDG